ncbi:MAG: hypothetical protein R2822_06280 [Spirosomataceae bacterium]
MGDNRQRDCGTVGIDCCQGGQIRIVSSTLLSPSTKAVIADFTAKYPTTKHIVYDANSVAGLVKAESSFNKAVVPLIRF